MHLRPTHSKMAVSGCQHMAALRMMMRSLSRCGAGHLDVARLPTARELFATFASPNRHNWGLSRPNSTAATEQPKEAESAKPPTGEPSPTEKALQEENKKLLEQIKEIDDKYKRALAENENVRQRMRRQIEEAKSFGIQSFCKDLLDVADVLTTAMESVPKEEVTAANPHLKNLYQGLEMTEAQLQSVFRRHGLTKINPVGEKFDPNVHEALFEQEDPSREPGTVSIVTKIGYKLRERTIRPALVGVVRATPSSNT